jgi:hypothetical protein
MAIALCHILLVGIRYQSIVFLGLSGLMLFPSLAPVLNSLRATSGVAW